MITILVYQPTHTHTLTHTHIHTIPPPPLPSPPSPVSILQTPLSWMCLQVQGFSSCLPAQVPEAQPGPGDSGEGDDVSGKCRQGSELGGTHPGLSPDLWYVRLLQASHILVSLSRKVSVFVNIT